MNRDRGDKNLGSPNYSRLGFYANSLLLNKKTYLLYNIFNKKKEFFCFKNKREERVLYKSSLILNTLKLGLVCKNFAKFDYFGKWSSSQKKKNELIIKNFFDVYKKKVLAESSKLLDLSVFDSIFSNYLISTNTKFFYFYKNNIFLEFMFKLTKKKKMKFKNFIFSFLFDNFYFLSKNYQKIFFSFYWENKRIFKFFEIIKGYMKCFFIKKIKNNICMYFLFIKKLKSKNFHFLDMSNQKSRFFSFFLKNKKNFHLNFLAIYFKFKYLRRKFNRRFYK